MVHMWAKRRVKLIQNKDTKQHKLYYDEFKPLFDVNQEFDEIIPGTYTYIQRNWINHEEARLFCINCFTLQWFLFRLDGRGKITFAPNNTVTLYEKYIKFGFLPMHIFWYGLLDGNTINWKHTEFVTPFKKIKNPKIAQELSQYPWSIKVFEPNYLVLKREIPNKDYKLIYGKNFILKPPGYNLFSRKRVKI